MNRPHRRREPEISLQRAAPGVLRISGGKLFEITGSLFKITGSGL
jgi:hypothetical protein